jgi:hypothetical protein
MEVYDLHFINSTTTPPTYCNVYVGLRDDDFGPSCLTFAKTTKPISIIDLIDQCPAPVPVPTTPIQVPIQVPILTPNPSPSVPIVPPNPVPVVRPSKRPHHICFSSTNTVEVKDVGPIPISQLRIGDFVKSRHDNTFTQVYGVGHWDPNEECIFLSISVDSIVSV